MSSLISKIKSLVTTRKEVPTETLVTVVPEAPTVTAPERTCCVGADTCSREMYQGRINQAGKSFAELYADGTRVHLTVEDRFIQDRLSAPKGSLGTVIGGHTDPEYLHDEQGEDEARDASTAMIVFDNSVRAYKPFIESAFTDPQAYLAHIIDLDKADAGVRQYHVAVRCSGTEIEPA